MTYRVLSLILIFSFFFRAPLPAKASQLSKTENFSFEQANIGLVIQELGASKPVRILNADKKLMPASNLKILTTYLALKYLPDTLIGFYYKAKQDTLYLLPTGDPTLLHPAFSKSSLLHFFNKINNQIKYISLNSHAWRARPLGKGWIWDDYSDYFMPENSLMPFYSNLINFRLNNHSSKKGHPNIQITPYLYSGTPLNINFHKLQKLGNYYTITRDLHQNKFFIKKEKRPFKQTYVPIITNNTEFTERVLNKLSGRKILISTEKISIDSSWQKFPSQSRDEVVYHMMTNSDNFIAEQLLLMISNQELGYMNRDSIIKYLYAKELKNLFLEDTAVWIDGSGLSVYNRFSAHQINTILNKTYIIKGSMKKIAKIYGKANNGTLKDYFANYEDNLFAKTGSMSHTFCLSGFFLAAKSQKWHSFSLLINNIILPTPKIKRHVEKYLNGIIQQL